MPFLCMSKNQDNLSCLNSNLIPNWRIILCYKQKIYHIDEKGALITNADAEYILSKEMNPKSPYWKIYV